MKKKTCCSSCFQNPYTAGFIISGPIEKKFHVNENMAEAAYLTQALKHKIKKKMQQRYTILSFYSNTSPQRSTPSNYHTFLSQYLSLSPNYHHNIISTRIRSINQVRFFMRHEALHKHSQQFSIKLSIHVSSWATSIIISSEMKSLPQR